MVNIASKICGRLTKLVYDVERPVAIHNTDALSSSYLFVSIKYCSVHDTVDKNEQHKRTGNKTKV